MGEDRLIKQIAKSRVNMCLYYRSIKIDSTDTLTFEIIRVAINWIEVGFGHI